MGLGGYQAGYLFDWSGTYQLAYAVAAAMGAVNLVVVGALYFFMRHRIALVRQPAAA